MATKRLLTAFVIGLFLACAGCGSSGNPVDLVSDEDSGGHVDVHDSVGDRDVPDGEVHLDSRDSEDGIDVIVDVVDAEMLDTDDDGPDDAVEHEIRFDIPTDEAAGGDEDVDEADQLDEVDATESDTNDGFGSEDVLDVSDGSTSDDTSTDTTVACPSVVAHSLCYGTGSFEVPDLKVFQPGEEALVSTYAAMCCNPVSEFTVPDLSLTTVVLVAEMVYQSCDSDWTVSELELCGDTLSAAVEFNVDPRCDLGFIACTLIQLDARAEKFVLNP